MLDIPANLDSNPSPIGAKDDWGFGRPITVCVLSISPNLRSFKNVSTL